jgi:hypothetical protein
VFGYAFSFLSEIGHPKFLFLANAVSRVESSTGAEPVGSPLMYIRPSRLSASYCSSPSACRVRVRSRWRERVNRPLRTLCTARFVLVLCTPLRGLYGLYGYSDTMHRGTVILPPGSARDVCRLAFSRSSHCRAAGTTTWTGCRCFRQRSYVGGRLTIARGGRTTCPASPHR